jgi:DNA-binding transcriptional regulator YdaS (Cro superfamily)
MQFADFVDARLRAGAKTRGAVLAELAQRAAGAVALSTLRSIDKGYRPSRVEVCRAIERATDGQVTMDDLCPPLPTTR